MGKNYLGRQVAELRERKCMTQEELAEQCSINVRTIQRIENGETAPRGNTLSALTRALGIRPEELFDSGLTTDKGYLILLYFSAVGGLIYPALSVLLPLILWVWKRNVIKEVDREGIFIMLTQVVWIAAYTGVEIYFRQRIATYGLDITPGILLNVQNKQGILKLIDLAFIFGGVILALFGKSYTTLFSKNK